MRGNDTERQCVLKYILPHLGMYLKYGRNNMYLDTLILEKFVSTLKTVSMLALVGYVAILGSMIHNKIQTGRFNGNIK